jgi:peptidyl-prolyl cis-trans isomerase SurA
MRNLGWVLSAVGLALLAVLAVASGQELSDRIVVIVDKNPIFQSDLDRAVEEELYYRKLRGEPAPSDSAALEALRKELLESLVDERIVIAKAAKESVEVTPTEVEDAVDQWLGDLKKSLGSDAALTSALSREGLTLEELKDRRRRDIADQLVVTKFMRRQFGSIAVSEGDMSDFYKNKYDSIPSLPEVVGISDIVVTPQISPKKEAEVARRVTGIQNRLKAGEDFARVAREASDDQLTRANGGEIGQVSLEDLQPDIAGVAAKLSVGQVSEPFRSAYGVEIVKLDSKLDDKYSLRHIFVRFAPDAADSAKALGLAEEIRSRLAAGENFETLARQYSADQTTKEKGGYLGEIEVGALDATYADAIAGLAPGEISQVISTSRGYLILRLVSRTAARKPGYDEAKGWIGNLLESRRREAEVAKWLEGARQDIFVKRLP